MSTRAGVAVDACAPPRPPAGRWRACSTGIPRLLSTTVITWFAVDSVGSLVSAKRIADFLKSQRRTTAVDTVLGDAFLLTPVPRSTCSRGHDRAARSPRRTDRRRRSASLTPRVEDVDRIPWAMTTTRRRAPALSSIETLPRGRSRSGAPRNPRPDFAPSAPSPAQSAVRQTSPADSLSDQRSSGLTRIWSTACVGARYSGSGWPADGSDPASCRRCRLDGVPRRGPEAAARSCRGLR